MALGELLIILGIFAALFVGAVVLILIIVIVIKATSKKE